MSGVNLNAVREFLSQRMDTFWTLEQNIAKEAKVSNVVTEDKLDSSDICVHSSLASPLRSGIDGRATQRFAMVDGI